jgi:crotonobetainyl-CoA:carnitine CoA-transferase CaiB-like acyl-CoA transferase
LRPPYGEGIRASLRYQYYPTSDGDYLMFNALEDKFLAEILRVTQRVIGLALLSANYNCDSVARCGHRAALPATFAESA